MAIFVIHISLPPLSLYRLSLPMIFFSMRTRVLYPVCKRYRYYIIFNALQSYLIMSIRISRGVIYKIYSHSRQAKNLRVRTIDGKKIINSVVCNNTKIKPLQKFENRLHSFCYDCTISSYAAFFLFRVLSKFKINHGTPIRPNE